MTNLLNRCFSTGLSNVISARTGSNLARTTLTKLYIFLLTLYSQHKISHERISLHCITLHCGSGEILQLGWGMGKRCLKGSSALIVVGAIFFSMSCGSGSSSTNSDTSPLIRFVQASPSQSTVNILVDSVSIATENYGAASGYLTVDQGSRHIQIEPNGSGTPFIDQNLSLSNGTNTTMVVAGETPNITGVVFTDEITPVTAGDASVRIINASPDMGPADVYIVTAGTSIANVTPTVSSLAFKSATSYQDIVPGSYEIFLTAPGSKSTFISTGTITLTTNQIRTFVAIDQLGGGFTQLTLADAD
jgi:hypothetical protein